MPTRTPMGGVAVSVYCRRVGVVAGPRQSRGVWGVARCDGGVEPVDSGMMRVPTHLVITEKSRGPTRVLIIPHHACLRPVAAGRVRHHR